MQRHRIGGADPGHLNTTREVYNQSQQRVWRKPHQEPFSDSLPEENPSGLGVFKYPLCESSYYFAEETGNPYAMYRDAYSQVHINDWRQRFGGDSCRDKPHGYLPRGGPDFARFVRQSECRAYAAGKACREPLVKCCPDAVAGIVRDNQGLSEFCD